MFFFGLRLVMVDVDEVHMVDIDGILLCKMVGEEEVLDF